MLWYLSSFYGREKVNRNYAELWENSAPFAHWQKIMASTKTPDEVLSEAWNEIVRTFRRLENLQG